MPPTIFINHTINLTPFSPEDKQYLVQYLNDPIVYRNTLQIPSPYTDEEAETWLKIVAQNREKLGTEANWVIRHQKDGLLGSIGRAMKNHGKGHLEEIGYWLAAPFRSQGIMTQVVQIYSDWLFANHPDLVRIEANVFPHNAASMRVLEKAGFEREGYARKLHVKNGVYLDSIRMAKIR
ncbi:MAG: GNAT family N-acetyltransferase [Lewinellaceae bacterium]|nr:GNAT family N-acetyltransferase [Saprospiraceae bacterium]MCB9315014.1 GNAT family N-acetyltransferase [Lewinellaceae bacterium]MCB9329805.1 GNAT family N-acetyltransferase [Lewinellaceae bacterium]